ncbi:NigD-like N-terminal domain-containing protein [Phocaeicola vulgatus]|nr:NigD-like N-terminal domain-containing protein [Phocaeicola vulgatus]
MKYFFQSMLGAMLLLSGVFAFSSCGNDESDPDSTVTIAMATVEKQPQYDAPYLVLDNGEKLWVVQRYCSLPGFEGRRTDFWKLFFFGSR